MRRPQFTLKTLLWVAACVAALLTLQTHGAFLGVAISLFLFWGLPFMPALFSRRP